MNQTPSNPQNPFYPSFMQQEKKEEVKVEKVEKADLDKKTEKKAKSKKSLLLPLLILGLIFAISAVAVVLYLQYQAAQERYQMISTQFEDFKNNPDKITQEEIKTLTEDLKKVFYVGTEEVPTVATVVDAEVLKKEQEFFKNAQTGDKVFMYVEIKKAILFRPSTKQVIEVAPLTVENSTNTQTDTPTTNN